jgi:polyisoprenyl-phosphate glycosyltransferase
MTNPEAARKKLVSIVCPVYNEQDSVPIFYERLAKVLAPHRDSYDFELIFTNNCSTDATLPAILALRNKDPMVQVLTFSRNFGYQVSVQAGMSNASGEAVIVIDVDCEDPPEMIPDFLAKWEQGYEIAYGVRLDRPENWFIKKLRALFYILLHRIADADAILYMAEFALISSNVRDVIVNNRNTYPFLRAEIGFAGFARHGIPYRRHPRLRGKTHYNIIGMFAFAIGGLLTSSTFALRLAGYLFPFLALANLVMLPDAVGAAARSFRLLMIVDAVFIAFVATICAIYIARIHKNVMGRPLFVVDRRQSWVDRKAIVPPNDGRPIPSQMVSTSDFKA